VPRACPRHDQVAVSADELGCKRWKAFGATVSRAIVDDEIFALRVSKLREALSERGNVGGFGRFTSRLQHANAPDPGGLLRPGGHRQRTHHATEQRYELAPFQSTKLHPLPLARVAA
jgi:hypothetical protein